MGCASSRVDVDPASHRALDRSSPPSTSAAVATSRSRRSLDIFHDALTSFRDHFWSASTTPWDAAPCEWLRVRAASYFVDAKKAPPRERPLLTLRHVDLFDGSSLASDGDDARVDFCRTRPESWFRREFERDGGATTAWTFAMHFVNPDGANLVCYFQPEGDGAESVRDARRLCDWVDANSSPSFAKTLRRFVETDDDAYRAARVKLCAKLRPQSPLMLRKCVPTKPVLVGKRASTRFFRGAGDTEGYEDRYLECCIECGTSASAKYLYNMFSGLSARSDEDLAIWIEGAREDELPERVLGAVRLRRISPKCLTKLTKLPLVR